MTAASTNPYRPGAGSYPPELAGRAQIVTTFAANAHAAKVTGEYQRPMLIAGRRGMGKTVLLTAFENEARELGLFPVHIEASPHRPLVIALAKGMLVALRHHAGLLSGARSKFKHALAAFKSFHMTFDPDGSYSVGVDVDAAAVANTGDLTQDLGDLFQAVGEAAKAADSAVVITVDELQFALPGELNALNMALHRIGQGMQPVPIVFVGAGLPSLPSLISESTPYAERQYELVNLNPLTAAQAATAIVVPSERLEVTWAPDAVDRVVEASAGYPFLLQEFGSWIWRSRRGNPVTAEDVEEGVALAFEGLDATLYSTRWEHATASERAFMIAMADDSDAPSAIANIADRLGKPVTGISGTRKRLISKQLIYPSETKRGELSFTVPGMALFINHRLTDD